MLDRELVIGTIEALLERKPHSESTIENWQRFPSIEAVVEEIVRGKEFLDRVAVRARGYRTMSVLDYFRPCDLRSQEEVDRRILLVGSCFAEPWPRVLASLSPRCSCEFHLVNNGRQVADRQPEDVQKIDFQVIHIPVRFILPDNQLMRFLAGDDDGGETLLQSALQRLDFYLDSTLTLNRLHGLETFILNMIVPQFAETGRLMPRYGTTSLKHIFEILNQRISEIIDELNNCFFIDMDGVASSFGKRLFLDDSILATNHGGFLANVFYADDLKRLEAPPPPLSIYENKVHEFISVMWNEVIASHETLKQVDSVKMVITDLDDTLWRGIIGEGESNPAGVEGWPLGYIETLLALKKRGVLLGLISKNTESLVVGKWTDVTGDRIQLSDFAITRINWEPKTKNMLEILEDVNLLPKSIVYVDDNPVERAAISQAFPGIRVLGSNPYTLKRTLLLSPETQVPVITAESKKRTSMIQAQSRRNTVRQTMSREEFLLSLKLVVRMMLIIDQSHERFARAFELLNKTNQFNTTGRRWSRGEMASFLAGGGSLAVFEVDDVFTSYGLVGVIVFRGHNIIQFVMSCRVIGLEVETTAVNAIISFLQSNGYTKVQGSVFETAANAVCRDVFDRSGFSWTGSEWIIDRLAPFEVPAHIQFSFHDFSPIAHGSVEALDLEE